MSKNHVLFVIGTDDTITKTIQREEFSVEQLQRAIGSGRFERLNGFTSFEHDGKVYVRVCAFADKDDPMTRELQPNFTASTLWLKQDAVGGEMLVGPVGFIARTEEEPAGSSCSVRPRSDRPE
jgi:hypothetical protein